jgi:hypothetical protein
MMEHICIDTTPSGEKCTGISDFDALRFMRIEARVYIKQLIRVYGENPPGTQFQIKHNDHDAGTYLDIHFRFDEENEKQVAYACAVDEGCESWDDESKQQLERLCYAFPNDKTEEGDEEVPPSSSMNMTCKTVQRDTVISACLMPTPVYSSAKEKSYETDKISKRIFMHQVR